MRGMKKSPQLLVKDANHLLTNECETPHDWGLYAFRSRCLAFVFNK